MQRPLLFRARLRTAGAVSDINEEIKINKGKGALGLACVWICMHARNGGRRERTCSTCTHVRAAITASMDHS